ncbi:MAG: hypothetical protein WCG80_10190 [Spirochaetales bacterium]
MRKLLGILVAAALAFALVSCASTPAPAAKPVAAKAKTVEFIPGAAPAVTVPAGVGALVDDLKARAELSAAFVEAYKTGILSEVEFKAGPVGDKIHHWGGLEGDKGMYAQNYEGNVANANTWGIPGFIMIAMPVDGPRAFIVKEKFIEKYSFGEGFEKNNGPAGYGAPLTDSYLQDGLEYQLFEKGLMVLDKGKVDFILGAAPKAIVPDSIGVITDDVKNPANTLSASRLAATSAAFKVAYAQGLLSDATFKGGSGDKVHHWGGLEGDKGILAQNCEGTRANANTWGIPGFIMISQAFDGGRAFLVKDKFIEKYSMGEGFEKNNAPAGYGAALTDQYVKDGSLRQLFEKGLMMFPLK